MNLSSEAKKELFDEVWSKTLEDFRGKPTKDGDWARIRINGANNATNIGGRYRQKYGAGAVTDPEAQRVVNECIEIRKLEIEKDELGEFQGNQVRHEGDRRKEADDRIVALAKEIKERKDRLRS